CSEALDCIEAYYKAALKRFVDDIAIEVIEAKLISPLYNIFFPITVASMPADLVTSIAGESEENRAQREQLNQQLEVLVKGIETCKRFVGVRILGVDDSTIQSENTSDSPSPRGARSSGRIKGRTKRRNFFPSKASKKDKKKSKVAAQRAVFEFD
ncbi:hypothetical protein DL95DRAFT_491127, partial [Leptodontidium sp. 2 PMI_412]